MYPQRELNALAAAKARLLPLIAAQRLAAVETSRALARPLIWIDRIRTHWTWIFPLLQIAAASMRRSRSRVAGIAEWLRWLPVGFTLLRGFVKARRKPAPPA